MERIIFKGKMGCSSIKELLHPSTFIQVFILTLLLIGEYLLFSWFLIFGLIAVFLLSLIMGSFFSLLFSLFPSGLLLDDEKWIIISKMPLRRRNIIPYERIKEIRISEKKNSLQVQAYVKTDIGRIKRVWLLATDKKDEKRLKEELTKRFIEIKSIHPKFSPLILASLDFAIIIGVCLFFTFNIYTKFPQVKIYPQRLSWKSENISLENRNFYTLHSVKFSLPKEFELIREKENALQFKSKEEVMLLIISGRYLGTKSFGITPKENGWKTFLILVGIKDDYDLLKATLHSRIGVIPLILKSLLLSKFDEVKISEIKKGQFKGFLFQGQKKGRRIDELSLFDKKGKRNVNFICSFKKEGNILKILNDIE